MRTAVLGCCSATKGIGLRTQVCEAIDYLLSIPHTLFSRISNVPGPELSQCQTPRYTHWYTHSGMHWVSDVSIPLLTLVVQNDLSEYFSLLNFANPNYLGTKNDFRKNFENHIIRGRDSDATDQDKAESEKKLKELGGLVTKFIIRRTNDLLSKYCQFHVLSPRTFLTL